MTFPEIEHRRQPVGPPIGYTKSFNLLRHGRLVYAVPNSVAGLDIEVVAQTNAPPLASARTVCELEKLIGEKVCAGVPPTLVDSYKCFNIIKHNGRLVALAQWLGPLRLPDLSDPELHEYQSRGACVIAASVTEIKHGVDRLAIGRGAGGNMASCNMQLLLNRQKSGARVSIVLLDWGVRESFHSIRYLNTQTVARSDYEVIWLEFYDRKPPELLRLMESTGWAALDTWLVMGYPDTVHYHKHRMYNAGIVLAHGQICVFCDSDAIFLPTFVESIVRAFEERPNAAIHLDEVRNYSKRFYPFNDPSLAEVLAEGCVNWTGTTTTGLDSSPDMIHAANYGACMAAWRNDLIRIGGADEHIDYLGYICGPYELTFRLVNLGREEHWLRNEYLYHVWHPNTSGCNVEYKGPDDGRGMSLPALEARDSGRIEPLKENPAIRTLRDGAEAQAVSLLALLVQEDDGAWKIENASQSTAAVVQRGYADFNITCYRGTWYALHRDEGAFDPAKVQNQEYRRCYSAASEAALLKQLAVTRRSLGVLVVAALRRMRLPRPVREYGKRLLRNRRRQPHPARFSEDDPNPYLVETDYWGFNIICCSGAWYGLDQAEGAFDPAMVQARHYRRLVTGDSLQDVKVGIRRQLGVYQGLLRFARRMARLVRR